MKGKLELTGMKFHAFHGCLPFERKIGSEYIVDFEAEVDVDGSDELNSTIDYSVIYNIVKAQMEQPSNLIEHVAGRIFKAIETEFPALEHFSIRLCKLAPPVEGPSDRACITLSK